MCIMWWSTECYPVPHESVSESISMRLGSSEQRDSCESQEKDYIVNEARRRFSENKSADEESIDNLVRFGPE
jgi:hypothetical protein